MERTLLVVEPAGTGWRVCLGHVPLACEATRAAAVDFATHQAQRRYASTGQPTGVKMAMHGGEAVLIAAHG